MSDAWQLSISDETRMRLLAEIVATKIASGDMITLRGDLGAGKTTFSRYLIRALLADDAVEVPSPTFTLLQTYEAERFPVRHFDLYRIAGVEELDELEFDDAAGECLTIVEWPERAEEHLGTCRLDVMISDGDSDSARQIAIAPTPDAAWRLSRMQARYEFLSAAMDAEALGALRLSYLRGDASTRSYARLQASGPSQLLMDMPKLPEGPVIRDGKTYSEIAHLAEDAQPFVAISAALRNAGLAAPSIDAFDAPCGMALIEDFGDLTFAAAMASGVPQDELWRAAVDVLVHLRRSPPSNVVTAAGGIAHIMPAYDRSVISAELELLCDWYWPYANGQPISDAVRQNFAGAWAPLIEQVATMPDNSDTNSWVLRDFHSPNLIWMPERDGISRVGVIDFQDAQIGHAAYDLVSLSLDARLDVPRELHEALLDKYGTEAAVQEPGFDEAAFRLSAAILGAQRNTKILGIFARLSMRDGKHGYLRHIPRIQSYLVWCLEHPALAELRAWYDGVLKPAE